MSTTAFVCFCLFGYLGKKHLNSDDYLLFTKFVLIPCVKNMCLSLLLVQQL